jgi:hypothetical protein
MRRYIFAIACIAILRSAPLVAQEAPPSRSSTVPAHARFEIVQSPLLAKLTFRFDRFTGQTWQFVSTKKDAYTWEPIERIELPGDTKVPGKVNYQIFLSGIRAQITVLLNTNTGVSWYIVEDLKQGFFWTPMQ